MNTSASPHPNLQKTKKPPCKTPMTPNMCVCTCSTPSCSSLNPNRRIRRSHFTTRSCWNVQRSHWSTGWWMDVNGLSSRWLPPSSSAWQLPVPLLSKNSPLWASSTQNYATASAPRLWKSLCSSRTTWQPSTIYCRWLSVSCMIAKMKINKTLFFCVKSGFLD